MFFKKELQVTRNAKECERIRQMLDSAGIKYSVKYGIGSIGDPDRSRGIPVYADRRLCLLYFQHPGRPARGGVPVL